MPYNQQNPMLQLQQLMNPGMDMQMPYVGPYNQDVYNQMNQQFQGMPASPAMTPDNQAPGFWNSMSDWFGDNGQMISGGLGMLSQIGGIYSGLQGLGEMKRQNRFQRNAWNENMDMQRKDLNRKLEGSWNDKVATGNTGNYKSLEDYLSKHRF